MNISIKIVACCLFMVLSICKNSKAQNSNYDTCMWLNQLLDTKLYRILGLNNAENAHPNIRVTDLELVQKVERVKKWPSAYLVSDQTYLICNRNLNGSPMTSGKV